jgi:hypothetical protein
MLSARIDKARFLCYTISRTKWFFENLKSNAPQNFGIHYSLFYYSDFEKTKTKEKNKNKRIFSGGPYYSPAPRDQGLPPVNGRGVYSSLQGIVSVANGVPIEILTLCRSLYRDSTLGRYLLQGADA